MAHLVVKQDGSVVFFEVLKPLVSLGRADDCDIKILNTRASRKHCQIEECEKGYRIVDLESANGTLVNQQKIDTKILEAGDTIEIGSTVITFEIERKDLLKIRQHKHSRLRKLSARSKTKKKHLKLSTKTDAEENLPDTEKSESEKLKYAKIDEDTSKFERTVEENPEHQDLSPEELTHAEKKAELIISIKRQINELLEHFQEEGVLELEKIITDYWDESVQESFIQPLLEDRYMMEQLLSISQRINSELNLNLLLDEILDETIEFTNAERCFLILFDKKGKPKVELARNIDKEAINKPQEKFSSSIVQMVKDTAKPLLSTNASEEERFDESSSVADMKLRSVLCVPIKLKDSVMGVLYIDNRFETGIFSERDLLWLETIADHASNAINNARLYDEIAQKTAELEKAFAELKESNAKIAELNALLEKKVEAQQEELVNIKEKLVKERREYSSKFNYDNIVGDSPAMQKLFAMIDKVTETEITVLLQGESGTGKELVARALHNNSTRKAGPFIAENCAAIPENLFESIFFGHTKGAFTGAVADKPGLCELADGGTLFLDEIGDLPFEMQKKFLRVLEDGEIRRVGGNKTKKVNFRLITATNQNLREMIAAKKFREDLFFRLNTITINLPPLRERKTDIPKLAKYFVMKYAEKNKTLVKNLSSEAMQALKNFDFPGNIRELENAIEQGLTMAGNAPEILVEHLSDEIRQNLHKSVVVDTKLTLKDAVKVVTEQVERELIEKVLAECRWKKVEAAERLGISRPTLDAKIEAYNIKPAD